MSPICKQINTEKHILYVAVSVLIVLIATYMYFVSASVVHVVMYKETVRSLSELTTTVSKLEAEYIAAQHDLSAQVAALPGFVAASEKIFIERSDTTLVIRDKLQP